MENNNDMKVHLDNMMKGIIGITSMLDSGFDDLKKNMTTDQAKEFAKAMESSNINEHVEEFKKTATDLKTKLNID